LRSRIVRARNRWRCTSRRFNSSPRTPATTGRPRRWDGRFCPVRSRSSSGGRRTSPRYVTAGHETLGLRVPKHDLCAHILRETGPLAATSANRSGLPAFCGGAGAGTNRTGELPDADLFVDDGATPLETESTVIDVSQTQAHVVRAGAIPIEQLEHVLGVSLR
jgi:tRNA A37 threonylcarbamoyladenosine synthetase subunit TsaC/SUA5/YrdC